MDGLLTNIQETVMMQVWEIGTLNKKKLPDGIGYLVKQAEAKGIKFGIWVEPEMVNPKSELYEKHPDWIIKLPNRNEDLQRNQLVLDLCNPRGAGLCLWHFA